MKRSEEADETAASTPQSAPSRLLVMTHHKCGSTFLRHYLQKFCDLNNFVLYHSHEGTAKPCETSEVSFLTNAVYSCVASRLPPRSLHVIRNPLDVIVSAYHSHRSTHSLENWPQLKLQRQALATCRPDEGMYLTLAFLERDDFYPDTCGPLSALRTWSFDDDRIHTVRMEDLVRDVDASLRNFFSATFSNQLDFPQADEFSFSHFTGGRAVGEVDPTSHYRSGLPDQWRDELPKPIVDYVRVHFKSVLDRYYPDAFT